MKLLWIISFLLLQDTEAFLLQNAKVKQCLQASLTDGDLLLSDCNSASDFQNWFWQGDSLRNYGTQSCLSVVEADRVQTSPCDIVGFTSWNCSNLLLFPLGSSQGYLVASKSGVALENVRGLKAQWQSAAEKSVCKEKAAAKYSFIRSPYQHYLSTVLTSTQVYEHTAYTAGLLLDMEPEKLEELLWFFRREDPSPWNYSMLALSFVVTILGFVLLAINISRNRKRKIHMYKEAAQAAKNSELESKQAFITVPEYSPESPQKPELLPQDERSGEVLVQWKDGPVTTLYRETAEDAM